MMTYYGKFCMNSSSKMSCLIKYKNRRCDMIANETVIHRKPSKELLNFYRSPHSLQWGTKPIENQQSVDHRFLALDRHIMFQSTKVTMRAINKKLDFY